MRAARRALIVALLALAGCGGSEEDQARERVEVYLQAAGEADYDTVCELYDPRILPVKECKRMLGDAAETDERPSKRDLQGLRDAEATGVRVNGDTAQVTTTLDDPPVDLAKVDGEWYVTGVDHP